MSIDLARTTTLPQYRVYVLDREKRIRRAEIVACADDQSAIVMARALASSHVRGWSLEVWQLARRVFSGQVSTMLTFLATDCADGTLDFFGLIAL